MAIEIINKKNEPIIFYYNTKNGKEVIRMKDGETVMVENFISVSSQSKKMIENKWVEIVKGEKIIENNELLMSLEEKMEQAKRDIELYINQEK